MSENRFIYRLLSAAIIVLICSAFKYSGIFASQTDEIGRLLSYSTDIGFIKDKISGKTFSRPANGVVTNGFSEEHSGIDIASEKEDEPILAAKGGTVIFSGAAEGYGNCIKIAHADGFVTLYGHMSELCVSEGDKVKKNQKIGIMGNSGDSSGRHLHYEVIKNDSYINPKGVTKGL